MLFFLWFVTNLLIAFIATVTVPYAGFFPYKELLTQYGLPYFIARFANFDGVHFLLVADMGYSQFEQAFFPLYPLAIKTLTFLTGNRLVSGLLISNVAFFAGLAIYRKFAQGLGGKIDTVSSILFLLLFPTSFYFGAVYTEGLFFLLFISSLYFLRKKQYWWAGIAAALSASTRLIGLFLIVPFAILLLWEKKNDLRSVLRRTLTFLPVLLSPLVGFATYALYLWKTVGDPLFFFHAQPSFGANRSTNLVTLPQVYFRYFKILLTANHNFQYFVSLAELLIFTFVLIILLLDLKKHYKNRERLALNIFSLINIVLPTLTGTFSSIPRYALFSVSIFLFMSEIHNLRLKKALYLILFLGHILFLSFFIQGYFVS